MNIIEKYGFEIKIYKDEKHGYTRGFDIDNNTRIILNIIPNDQPKWICEKVTFDLNTFNEILNHKILNNEDFINSGKSKFDYSMQELGYTTKSYQKVSRWAYVESKEEALEEILFKYSYLFENKQ